MRHGGSALRCRKREKVVEQCQDSRSVYHVKTLNTNTCGGVRASAEWVSGHQPLCREPQEYLMLTAVCFTRNNVKQYAILIWVLRRLTFTILGMS